MTPASVPSSHASETPDDGPALLVGLDIGGSKTHGALWRDGALVAEHKAGSANVQNVSVEEATRHLRELFDALLADAPQPAHIDRVVAGSGGVDTAVDADRLRDLIAVHAPHAAVDVVHDTRLILAAGGAATGIAVIAGTGSVAWGVDDAGRQARSGGWGYLLGDEGSGYWVAREAVRRTLHRYDLGHSPDALDIAVLAGAGVGTAPELIGLFHTAGRTFWAARSPIVFDAASTGSDDAAAIIEQAAADLTALVLDVTATIGIPGPVVLGGGLAMHQPVLQAALRRRLAAAGMTHVVVLDADPVRGVPFLAGSAG